jgi:dTDP-glucose pyrophosphorylase
MMPLQSHLIHYTDTIRQALQRLDQLAQDALLFVVDNNQKLVGSLTDGDIRRGLLNGKNLSDSVELVCNPHPKFVYNDEKQVQKLKEFRVRKYGIVPILNHENELTDIINFRFKENILPLTSVIMAGGKGERLRPLTNEVPKPLLKVGEKPIIQYSLDLLSRFGVKKCVISTNYLHEQLKDFAAEKSNDVLNVSTVKENEPLGTIGAIKLIQDFNDDYLLVSNSDLLSNVDLEDFFIDFLEQDADLSVLGIPYSVNVPYAVLSTDKKVVQSLHEKPTYTYYANGGMYLFKKELVAHIPNNTYFTAVDFIDALLKEHRKVITYTHNGYWLDIGKHEDFRRANEDIKHLKLWD